MDTIIRNGIYMNADPAKIISQIPGWADADDLEINSWFKLH